ncbi:MAG TPA: hypothetical protein VN238_03795, partial [Solirubrobacteraceae bacterium]|nr:hypothetical protein [Solirubrobacteraceae bacterium]
MPETVTYRGRSLEEVLPKIREELGPDAVIERQRTGLVGGVGGFFQREMVEVDARPAKPGESASMPGAPEGGGLNVLAGADEEDDLRAAARPAPPTREEEREEGLSAPAMQRIARQSEPFADLLRDAEADLPPLRDDAPAPTAARGGDTRDADLDDDDAPELDEQDWEAWGDELAPPRAGGPSPGGSFAANAYRTAGTEPTDPEPEPEPRFSPEADAGAREAEPPRITRAPRP